MDGEKLKKFNELADSYIADKRKSAEIQKRLSGVQRELATVHENIEIGTRLLSEFVGANIQSRCTTRAEGVLAVEYKSDKQVQITVWDCAGERI